MRSQARWGNNWTVYQSAAELITRYDLANYSSACFHRSRQVAVKERQLEAQDNANLIVYLLVLPWVIYNACTWQCSHILWLDPKSPLTLWHGVGDFYVIVLTSRSFLRHTQSLNCVHNGLKGWKYSCSHVSSKTVESKTWAHWCRPCAAGGSEAPLWMWDPRHRRATSAGAVVPEGLWSVCASKADAFCTLNSKLQVSD